MIWNFLSMQVKWVKKEKRYLTSDVLWARLEQEGARMMAQTEIFQQNMEGKSFL